jgi:hypothetical protein
MERQSHDGTLAANSYGQFLSDLNALRRWLGTNPKQKRKFCVLIAEPEPE